MGEFFGGWNLDTVSHFAKESVNIFHDSFDSRGESVNDWGKTALQNSATRFLGSLFCVNLVQLCRARGEVFLPRFGEGRALRGFPMAWVCGNSRAGNHPRSLNVLLRPLRIITALWFAVWYTMAESHEQIASSIFSSQTIRPSWDKFLPTRTAWKNLQFQGQDLYDKSSFFLNCFFCVVSTNIFIKQILTNSPLQSFTFHNFWPLFEVKPDIDAVFALGCILLVLLFGAPEMEAKNRNGGNKGGKH